jgi:rubrerythrin
MGTWGNLSAQTAFYRLAAQKEDESLRLYEELREQRETEEDKALFSYLVRQERQHLELLEQLSEMLRRSDEWVESAEFGIRPEY